MKLKLIFKALVSNPNHWIHDDGDDDDDDDDDEQGLLGQLHTFAPK
jgi:hypothetical protein